MIKNLFKKNKFELIRKMMHEAAADYDKSNRNLSGGGKKKNESGFSFRNFGKPIHFSLFVDLC